MLTYLKLTLTIVLIFLALKFEQGNSRQLHSNPSLFEDEFLNGTFPKDFEWGFATASYQVEGGWNEDGKGENIWDRFVHQIPNPVFDNSTGDIACDSYHKYKEDVQLLKNLGANYYRFSLSWSRILPTGTLKGGINQAGIAYYNSLLNELKANGISAFVTIYHWDLPQPLQDIGGWQNETMADYFEDFARLAFDKFGDRVDKWLTFNEPWVFCVLGYGNTILAPAVAEPLHAHYDCIHNVLKSHANAYHVYKNEFQPKQKGKCGITLDSNWYEPASDSKEDIEAAERARQFQHAWMGSPLFHGKYPDVMRELVDAKSAAQGFNVSRLPVFDDYWTKKINGSLDFLGLNHYSTELVKPFNGTSPDWHGDRNAVGSRDDSWEGTVSGKDVVPWGFRKLLNWIKNTYGNPELYVTENGYAEDGTVTSLHDDRRVNFYKLYINEALKAITIDGCNVKSYTAWSLLDNFEWPHGYMHRFGIHWVNFTDPARPRYPKDSVTLLKKIIADNGFPLTD